MLENKIFGPESQNFEPSGPEQIREGRKLSSQEYAELVYKGKLENAKRFVEETNNQTQELLKIDSDDIELDNIDFESDTFDFNEIQNQTISKLLLNPESFQTEITETIISGISPESKEYCSKFIPLLKHGRNIILDHFDEIIKTWKERIKKTRSVDIKQIYQSFLDEQVSKRSIAINTLNKSIRTLEQYIGSLESAELQNSTTQVENPYLKQEAEVELPADENLLEVYQKNPKKFVELIKTYGLKSYIKEYISGEGLFNLSESPESIQKTLTLLIESGVQINENLVTAMLENTSLKLDFYETILKICNTQQKELIIQTIIKIKPKTLLLNANLLLKKLPLDSKTWLSYAKLVYQNLSSIDASKIPDQVLYHISRYNKTETAIFKAIYTKISKARLIQPEGLNRNAIARQLTTQPQKILNGIPIETHLLNFNNIFPYDFNVLEANDALKQLYILTKFKKPTRGPYYEIGTNNIPGAKLLAETGVVKLQAENPDSGLILIDRSKITTELIYNLLTEASEEDRKERESLTTEIQSKSNEIQYKAHAIEENFLIPNNYQKDSILGLTDNNPTEFQFKNGEKFPLIKTPLSKYSTELLREIKDMFA